jgi:multidrug efflux pump subunit AcrA (membrane-fusion protein)
MTRFANRRAAVVAALILLIVAIGLWFVTHQASAAPQYRMATATLGTVTQTIPISGNLTPVNQADLDFGASGRVQSIRVQAGQQVNAGDVLATLDTNTLDAALTTAQANLQSAQARMSLDRQGATPQTLAQADAAINTATVQLQNAQVSLADTAAANAQSLAQAQAAVNSDQATVNADQGVLSADRSRQQSDTDRMNSDCGAGNSNCSSDQQAVSSDNQKVASDQQTLTRDQGSLNQATGALAGTQVKNQQSYDQAAGQVNSATVSLQNAQSSLRALELGGTQQQLAMDQSAVAIAQVNVETAQRAVGQATLTAPVQGTVSAVNLAVGQAVSGTSGSSGSSGSSGGGSTASVTATHAVSLLTPGAYQVTGSVSDAQVGQVATGQQARVIPAGSTEALTGKVTGVSPVATVTSGVATFAVTVTLDAADLTLHSGTSAAVSIIVNQVVGVVTIPTSAVRSSGTGSGVQVLVNGQPQTRPIQTGASDTLRTQVISGLSVGDQVVVATITRTVPTTTGGGGGGLLNPGGAGGGRARGGGGG